MKDFLKTIFILIVGAGLAFMIYSAKKVETKNVPEQHRLMVNGDNIAYNNEPYIEDGVAYIPLDIVNKLIDKYLAYDKSSKTLIYTDENKVEKYKVGKKEKTVNFKEEKINHAVEVKDNIVYVPVAEFKDYGLEIRINKDKKMIAIDDKNSVKSKIKVNDISLYKDMKLDSEVLEKLTYDEEIYVYEDKLNHARWLKVSTDDGAFGYIPKVAYEKGKAVENKTEVKAENKSEEQIVMFWQQGNSMSVLGDKIDAVNTVSPDWFDISDSNGNFSDKVDQTYLTTVRGYGYNVWPMFSNVNTKSATSITSELVNSEEKREKTIKNILSIVKKYNFQGVNLDFEAMKEEDKGMFTQFVRELAPILKANNIKLSVDIYFVNYVERSEIGKVADYVVLMAYDQHWSTSSVAGSVAELSWVQNNIESLIKDSKIPSTKIILAVPFYSKLWTVDASGNVTNVNNLSLEATQNYLTKYRMTTSVDEKSGQNYAERTAGGVTYKLWIEDSSSMEKRAKQVKDNKLAGISAWQKFFDTPSIWNTITSNIK